MKVLGQSHRMRVPLSILFLLTTVSYGSSWCTTWRTGSFLKVCPKSLSDGDCERLKNDDSCSDFGAGDSFQSGKTLGDYQCIIYKGKGCTGTYLSVDEKGWNQFPIKPKSFKCPCVKH